MTNPPATGSSVPQKKAILLCVVGATGAGLAWWLWKKFGKAGGESHSANVEGNANVVVMVDANAANAVNIVNNHYHAPLQSTQVQVQSTESSPSSAVPSDETGRQLAVGTARRRAAD